MQWFDFTSYFGGKIPPGNSREVRRLNFQMPNKDLIRERDPAKELFWKLVMAFPGERVSTIVGMHHNLECMGNNWRRRDGIRQRMVSTVL